MSVHKFSAYKRDYRYYIYSLFCKDSGGAGYVKFGISRRIDLRMSQIRTSCPLAIKMVALLQVRTEERQRAVEKSLHERFKARRLRGEWFSFDFSSSSDRSDFNSGSREVFAAHLREHDDQYWSKIDVKVLDAMAKDAKDRYMAMSPQHKILAKQNAATNKAVTCR